MPAGWPYFAWIDASETTFGSEHLRWDEQVFSFKLSQDEGNPASLTVVVRRPRNVAGDPIGLLGPGRKIWAWFALDCGPALIKFRGRLVGIPTSIFEELVTLEFVARPVDIVAQKEALAATLRVLPFYDPAVIDPARGSDPDLVLEGYTKIWAYDRESHVVTVSDEITGEDGLVEFDGDSESGKVLYDGLGLTLTSGPLARVDITAEFTWTQQARGTVDLTDYLTSNWPNAHGGIFPSFKAGDWPTIGAQIGDGWIVAESTAHEVYDLTPITSTGGSTLTVKWPDGGSRTTSITQTESGVAAPITAVIDQTITDDIHVTYSHGNWTSFSRNFSRTTNALVVQAIKATLVASYSAERQCTERVLLTLFADVQSILTDPEDGEALRIDDIRSVNLSESTGSEVPIGDPRRRSYIATERGNRSIEYLIVLARAHLMKRARVIEIAFAPKLSRMPEITLRKNAFLVEPRVGEALGKIIGYSLVLDGSDGRINCEVRIGCTIGRGGSAVTTSGTPTYCTTDYVGHDYQQFTDRVVLFDGIDSSVGYQPPNAAPNDDGINFLSNLTADNVIESGLVVTYGPFPDEQGDIRNDGGGTNERFPQYESRGTFKLKSMTREFTSDYELQVTDLKIPTGYDLEAV